MFIHLTLYSIVFTDLSQSRFQEKLLESYTRRTVYLSDLYKHCATLCESHFQASYLQLKPGIRK